MDPQQPNAARCTSSRVLAAVGMGAVGIYGAKVLINVFGPRPQFTMRSPGVPLDSEEFVQFLSLLTDGTRRRSRLKRLKNGDEFYPEELRAIESARHAINMEYYEFSEGDVSRRILAALCEKARAGVDVRMVIDAAGSIHTSNHYFDSLREAGGKMRWYYPLRWDTWPKFNQRTHRKLLIVDGQIGFIGGAGIANHWLHATRSGPRWRDTVFRVDGEGVAGLISTFAENWLEASGEILSGHNQFSFQDMPEGMEGIVVSSTPRDGGTQARVLFQALIRSAQQSIHITTPYFLPDQSARRAFVEALQRGIQASRSLHRPSHRTQGEPPCHPRTHPRGRGNLRLHAFHDSRQTHDGGWSMERGGFNQFRSSLVRAERRSEHGDPRSRPRFRHRFRFCRRSQTEPQADRTDAGSSWSAFRRGSASGARNPV